MQPLADAPAVDPRPFSFTGARGHAVLLHGLTGTPYEVRTFGMALHEAGYSAHAPLLAGHGSVTKLEGTTWLDWYESAREALHTVSEPALLLGFSMGGLLALRLCAQEPERVAGVIAISVPLALPSWQRIAISGLARLRLTPGIGALVGTLPKHAGVDVRMRRAAEHSPSLDRFPYPALAELVALQRDVHELLPAVRAPMLLLHGKLDHTASVDDAQRLSQRVGSASVQTVILPRSFHIVGLDVEMREAAQHVCTFAAQVLPGSTPANLRPPM